MIYPTSMPDPRSEDVRSFSEPGEEEEEEEEERGAQEKRYRRRRKRRELRGEERGGLPILRRCTRVGHGNGLATL